MKKIGIISDTHAWWDDRYAQHFADCDEVWHAGDIGSDELADKLEAIAPVFRAVCGNVDGASLRRRFKEMEIFEVEGVKVVMTHIGGYPGKYAPGIRQRLELSQPKLFVCGHSHILKVMYDKDYNLLHINPGAAGRQGFHRVSTLVRFTIDGGKPGNVEILDFPKV